jgi:chromosome segregation ATPase
VKTPRTSTIVFTGGLLFLLMVIASMALQLREARQQTEKVLSAHVQLRQQMNDAAEQLQRDARRFDSFRDQLDSAGEALREASGVIRRCGGRAPRTFTPLGEPCSAHPERICPQADLAADAWAWR